MKSEDPCAHLDKSTVLIVDDERANRLVLQDLLRCNRIESECVETGEEATAYLNSHSVDLILLDVNTDGMAELSLLRKLREAYSRTELSIVIITARSDSSYVVSALQHGANDYITTPIDSDEVLARVVTQLQMVQAQKALRASEERYSLAAKATNDGLWDWDLRKNEVYYSERWKSMLGIEETATLRSPADWFERIYQADRSRVESEFEDHLNGNSPHIETELRMLHADGTCRWMYCRGLAFRDESGMALRLAGSLSDVSARKVVDALTSLPNRMLFLDRITRSLDYSKRIGKEAFAVLFIDLDNFKLINDSLGHDVGDQLLIAIAERLESSVRSHETVVGRLGGDEFAVLIERIEDRAEAEVVAGRILKRICEPCLFGVNEIFPCASIGISFGKMQESAEEVIREADTAMYEAKSSGKARVSQFDPDMHREVTERLTLQNQLRKAVLSDDQLILHYQPIVNLQSGAIVGFEALMRWQHPENKLVS
ncbi:MAG: diguanylate cyclase, partial [Planctomycetales bacterium]|nr:diguanylate cyclase [Planctomycetales bacterium]